jgi:ribosomal protein S1
MIERFLQAAERAHLDLDDIQVLDILWLAYHRGAFLLPEASPKEEPTEKPVEQRNETSPPENETEAQKKDREAKAKDKTDAPPPRTDDNSDHGGSAGGQGNERETEHLEPGDLFADSELHTGSGPGLPILPIAPRAIPNLPEITRAIRPLKKRIPSRTRMLLDEQATAARIADHKIWLPVFVAERDRPHSLIIVIEDTPSMELWTPVVSEWSALLERLGAFRRVRTLYLQKPKKESVEGEPSAGIEPPVGLTPERGRRAENPAKDLRSDPGELILVISDCVSPEWWSNEIPQILQGWAERRIVSLSCLLPPHLWHRTAIKRAQTASIDVSRECGRIRPGAGFALPLLILDPPYARAWARGLTGMENAPAFVWRENPALVDIVRASGPDSPEDLVTAFERVSSPLARRLLTVLSSVPLDPPVIRLVQAAYCPDATPAHLAEIFLSGLVRRYGKEFDFVPGVRRLLLENLTAPELVQIHQMVSNLLVNPADGIPFEAFLADPEAALRESKSREATKFATVTVDVLRRLGGTYSKAVNKVWGGGAVGPSTATTSFVIVFIGPTSSLVGTITRMLTPLTTAFRAAKWRVPSPIVLNSPAETETLYEFIESVKDNEHAILLLVQTDSSSERRRLPSKWDTATAEATSRMAEKSKSQFAILCEGPLLRIGVTPPNLKYIFGTCPRLGKERTLPVTRALMNLFLLNHRGGRPTDPVLINNDKLRYWLERMTDDRYVEFPFRSDDLRLPRPILPDAPPPLIKVLWTEPRNSATKALRWGLTLHDMHLAIVDPAYAVEVAEDYDFDLVVAAPHEFGDPQFSVLVESQVNQIHIDPEGMDGRNAEPFAQFLRELLSVEEPPSFDEVLNLVPEYVTLLQFPDRNWNYVRDFELTPPEPVGVHDAAPSDSRLANISIHPIVLASERPGTILGALEDHLKLLRSSNCRVAPPSLSFSGTDAADVIDEDIDVSPNQLVIICFINLRGPLGREYWEDFYSAAERLAERSPDSHVLLFYDGVVRSLGESQREDSPLTTLAAERRGRFEATKALINTLAFESPKDDQLSAGQLEHGLNRWLRYLPPLADFHVQRFGGDGFVLPRPLFDVPGRSVLKILWVESNCENSVAHRDLLAQEQIIAAAVTFREEEEAPALYPWDLIVYVHKPGPSGRSVMEPTGPNRLHISPINETTGPIREDLPALIRQIVEAIKSRDPNPRLPQLPRYAYSLRLPALGIDATPQDEPPTLNTAEQKWAHLEKAWEDQEPLQARVIAQREDGFDVDLGLLAFLPVSYTSDDTPMPDETIMVQIQYLDREADLVIVASAEFDHFATSSPPPSPGMVVAATIEDVFRSGVSLEIGSDGCFVPRSEIITDANIRWENYLQPDQIVLVKILEPRPSGKLNASIRQALPDPAVVAAHGYREGVEVTATVVHTGPDGTLVTLPGNIPAWLPHAQPGHPPMFSNASDTAQHIIARLGPINPAFPQLTLLDPRGASPTGEANVPAVGDRLKVTSGEGNGEYLAVNLEDKDGRAWSGIMAAEDWVSPPDTKNPLYDAIVLENDAPNQVLVVSQRHALEEDRKWELLQSRWDSNRVLKARKIEEKGKILLIESGLTVDFPLSCDSGSAGYEIDVELLWFDLADRKALVSDRFVTGLDLIPESFLATRFEEAFPYGVVIDEVGTHRFVPRSDVSFSPPEDLASLFQPGQVLLAKFLDEEMQRPSGYTLLYSIPHPEEIDEYPPGRVLTGTVEQVDFEGAIIALDHVDLPAWLPFRASNRPPVVTSDGSVLEVPESGRSSWPQIGIGDIISAPLGPVNPAFPQLTLLACPAIGARLRILPLSTDFAPQSNAANGSQFIEVQLLDEDDHGWDGILPLSEWAPELNLNPDTARDDYLAVVVTDNHPRLIVSRRAALEPDFVGFQIPPEFEGPPTTPEPEVGDLCDAIVTDVQTLWCIVRLAGGHNATLLTSELANQTENQTARPGDRFPVLVMPRIQDKLTVSKRAADLDSPAWQRVFGAFRSGDSMEATILEAQSHQVILDVGLPVFMPLSLTRGTGHTLGQKLQVRIAFLDRDARSVVVSDLPSRYRPGGHEADTIATMSNGEFVLVRVHSLLPIGIEAQIGDGETYFIPLREIAPAPVQHPSEVLQENQWILAKVLNIDHPFQPLLSPIEAVIDPETLAREEFQPGREVTGTIRRREPNGLVISLPNNVPAWIPLTPGEPLPITLPEFPDRTQQITATIGPINPAFPQLLLTGVKDPTPETASSSHTAEDLRLADAQTLLARAQSDPELANFQAAADAYLSILDDAEHDSELGLSAADGIVAVALAANEAIDDFSILDQASTVFQRFTLAPAADPYVLIRRTGAAARVTATMARRTSDTERVGNLISQYFRLLDTTAVSRDPDLGLLAVNGLFEALAPLAKDELFTSYHLDISRLYSRVYRLPQVPTDFDVLWQSFFNFLDLARIQNERGDKDLYTEFLNHLDWYLGRDIFRGDAAVNFRTLMFMALVIEEFRAGEPRVEESGEDRHLTNLIVHSNALVANPLWTDARDRVDLALRLVSLAIKDGDDQQIARVFDFCRNRIDDTDFILDPFQWADLVCVLPQLASHLARIPTTAAQETTFERFCRLLDAHVLDQHPDALDVVLRAFNRFARGRDSYIASAFDFGIRSVDDDLFEDAIAASTIVDLVNLALSGTTPEDTFDRIVPRVPSLLESPAIKDNASLYSDLLVAFVEAAAVNPGPARTKVIDPFLRQARESASLANNADVWAQAVIRLAEIAEETRDEDIFENTLRMGDRILSNRALSASLRGVLSQALAQADEHLAAEAKKMAREGVREPILHPLIRVRVCQIRFNDEPVASGFLVGPDLVLTAAHPFSGRADTGWTAVFSCPDPNQNELYVERTPVSFDPAQNVDQPNGDTTLLRLPQPIGDLPFADRSPAPGWFTPSAEPPPIASGDPFFIFPFSLDIPGIRGGKVDQLVGDFILHNADVQARDAGAPCFNQAFDLVAIQTAKLIPADTPATARALRFGPLVEASDPLAAESEKSAAPPENRLFQATSQEVVEITNLLVDILRLDKLRILLARINRPSMAPSGRRSYRASVFETVEKLNREWRIPLLLTQIRGDYPFNLEIQRVIDSIFARAADPQRQVPTLQRPVSPDTMQKVALLLIALVPETAFPDFIRRLTGHALPPQSPERSHNTLVHLAVQDAVKGEWFELLVAALRQEFPSHAEVQDLADDILEADPQQPLPHVNLRPVSKLLRHLFVESEQLEVFIRFRIDRPFVEPISEFSADVAIYVLLRHAYEEGWVNDILAALVKEFPNNLDVQVLSSLNITPPLDFPALQDRLERLSPFVCQIRRGGRYAANATLVGPDLVLTANHVLNVNPEEGPLSAAFTVGNESEIRIVPLASQTPVASSPTPDLNQPIGDPETQLDYALLRLSEPIAIPPLADGSPAPGYPTLDPGANVQVGDPVIVIQYLVERDETQAFAARNRQTTFADQSVTELPSGTAFLRHVTPCGPGASGSPCFNRDLQLVAMNHASRTASSASPAYTQAILIGPIARDLLLKNISLQPMSDDLLLEDITLDSLPPKPKKSKKAKPDPDRQASQPNSYLLFQKLAGGAFARRNQPRRWQGWIVVSKDQRKIDLDRSVQSVSIEADRMTFYANVAHEQHVLEILLENNEEAKVLVDGVHHPGAGMTISQRATLAHPSRIAVTIGPVTLLGEECRIHLRFNP